MRKAKVKDKLFNPKAIIYCFLC